MTNWFYMNRSAFASLLNDELGENLTRKLLSFDFDIPVSFMIGETSDEILIKIQQTFSRHICRTTICNDHCLSCSLSPPMYAKLAWFVQRLIIMSPISKPFVKKLSSANQDLKCMKDKNIISHDSNQNDLSDIHQIKSNTAKTDQVSFLNLTLSKYSCDFCF